LLLAVAPLATGRFIRRPRRRASCSCFGLLRQSATVWPVP